MPDPERHELISSLQRALVIFSHPDDAEFGAAASIAALTAAGARVDYVVTTDGGKGTEDPSVTPQQLSAVREAEQRAAADVLGSARSCTPATLTVT
jgi:LmbE family N-acetylglucosaminyl deacetylase